MHDVDPSTAVGHDPRRGDRNKQHSAHFDSYIYYSARAEKPISLAFSINKESPGLRYPLKNYVTCTRFSSPQQNFLAALTKVV